jgi:hypothetical protein
MSNTTTTTTSVLDTDHIDKKNRLVTSTMTAYIRA